LRERTARGRYYDAVANQTDDELTKNNLFDEEKKDIE
jgi:hypothetical protein